MTPRKKKPAAKVKRSDGCALCGEQRLVEATDNQGNAYLGCPRCTIVLEPTLLASPKVKRSEVETRPFREHVGLCQVWRDASRRVISVTIDAGYGLVDVREAFMSFNGKRVRLVVEQLPDVKP